MTCNEIYSNGIKIENTTIVVPDGKWYKISLPTGYYSEIVYWIVGENEQEALDNLADFLESNNVSGLYKTFDEVWDEAEKAAEKFEDYEQNYVCCGTHGIYLDALLQIKLITKGEEIV